MRFPFDSPEAKQLNKEIFETIYFAALDASCELAEKFGPYETYEGSPVSKGILQHDMWNVQSVSSLLIISKFCCAAFILNHAEVQRSDMSTAFFKHSWSQVI